jgi:hypothetical protein
MGEWLMDLGHYRSMDNRTKSNDEITTPEQHQIFKQMLLRLLDDPQIQQKIGTFLRRSGLTRWKSLSACHEAHPAVPGRSICSMRWRAPAISVGREGNIGWLGRDR